MPIILDGTDPVGDLGDALNAKANLASPTFTGTPAAPTAAAGTNTTQIATTAFVQSGRSFRFLGSASLSGSSTILTGIFSSPFLVFRVILGVDSSTGTGISILGQLRSGTTTQTSNYLSNLTTVSSAWTSGSTAVATSTSGFIIGYRHDATGTAFSSFDIANPNNTVNTTVIGNYASTASGNGGTVQGLHTTATAYDSLVISPQSGTFTGSVQVFAYSAT